MPWTKNGNIRGPGVYGTAGLIAGAKVWAADVVTTTGGAWTANLTTAGFTAVPRVFVQAISAGTALNQSANASVTARSATAVSGFVELPNTIALGGAPNTRAGTGITVSVFAVGP